MSSIAATVDSKRAQVRLDIDLSDALAPAVTVTRLNLTTGVSTVVRSYGSTLAGAPTTLLGRLVLYDTEAPLDVPLQYTAAYNSGSTLIIQNLNPYFENGTKGGWVGQNNATFSVTNAQFHQGLWSGQVTPDGITAVPQAMSEEFPVLPSKAYTFGSWLRSTSAATRVAGIFWFNAAHAFVSSNTVSTALLAGVWTQYGPIVYTSPSTAAFARIKTNDPATPAAANTWQIDEATVSTTVNVSVSSAVVIVPGNGLGWLKDPVRPANSVQLDCRRVQISNLITGGAGVAYLGLGDQVYASNSGLFNIGNNAYPIGVSRPREAATSSLRVLARSAPDVAAIKALMAPGSAMLLQLPALYAEDDRYIWPGTLTQSFVFNDQRRTRRGFSFPFAGVQAPVGPMQGTPGIRWTDLCGHQSTWGAVYAAGGGTYDGFNRTVAAGSWGAPDVAPSSGASYTLGGTAADMSVNGTAGLIGISVVNTPDRAFLGFAADSEQYLTVVAPVVALGAGYQVAVLARHVDASNYYRLGIEFGLAGATLIIVTKFVAAVETVVASVAGPTYAAGQTWRIHASIVGTALKVSGWKDGTPEPVEFSVSTTDAALGAAAPYGVYARANTGNTNVLPIAVQVDDYQVKGSVTWTGIMDGVLNP